MARVVCVKTDLFVACKTILEICCWLAKYHLPLGPLLIESETSVSIK